MKNILLTLLAIIVTATTFGQDKIVKRDLSEILCKVSEIGSTEIKYKKFENIEGPTYTIKKSEVLKIEFENGTVEKFETNEMSVMPTKNRSYKRAFTTRPFSLIGGHLCLGYQHALSGSKALIAEVGFIGPGVGSAYAPAKGGYARVGFRLKRSPEVVMEGQEWGYNLGGMYIQPELTFASFSREQNTTNWITGSTSSSTYNYNSGAFLITIGKQMIAGEIMTFDLSTSIGYAFTSSTNPNREEWGSPRYYSHNAFGSDMPLAWNFTFSMGFLAK